APSIFGVTGYRVSQYQVFFGYPEGGSPAVGSVTQNGSPIATDQAVTLNNLSNVSFVGAAVQGVDKIWLKAYNGSWTNWVEADLTDPGITPINQAVAENQTVSLTSIFSGSSGDTQYQVWFSYPQGNSPALGTVTNGGTPIAQD